ncbi:hypothetical protein [Clostridium intestinale]|nr:hypothetical protein [Clostridium intestinale]
MVKKKISEIYKNELTTKKNLLEAIDAVKASKNTLNDEDMQSLYNEIYNSIDEMKDKVKANTILYLKNHLKSTLGKYVKDKEENKTSHFIEFFKKAYPPKSRRKDFTWVLIDINKISYEQIWHTLTYINNLNLKGKKFTSEEKDDIIPMIDKLLSSGDSKYINQIKSFSSLQSELNIKIVLVENEDNILKTKKIK